MFLFVDTNIGFLFLSYEEIMEGYISTFYGESPITEEIRYSSCLN